MDTNLTANNSPFNIGLDPNLHPLLAPESIFPTTIHPTNLLAPLETQALHFTANSTIYADGGATNLNNLLYTPFSGVVNSNPLLNSFLNSSSLSLSTTPQNSSPPPPVTVAPPQPTHNFAIQAGRVNASKPDIFR